MCARALANLLILISMDTNKYSNYAKVEAIKRQNTSMQLYESFLESGPELILQISIVIRTGNICKMSHKRKS